MTAVCGNAASTDAAGTGYSLDQITVEWNRLWRSIDRVNLIYPFDAERIHMV